MVPLMSNLIYYFPIWQSSFKTTYYQLISAVVCFSKESLYCHIYFCPEKIINQWVVFQLFIWRMLYFHLRWKTKTQLFSHFWLRSKVGFIIIQWRTGYNLREILTRRGHSVSISNSTKNSWRKAFQCSTAKLSNILRAFFPVSTQDDSYTMIYDV